MSLFGKDKDEGNDVPHSDGSGPSHTAAAPSRPGRGRGAGDQQMANIGKSISIKGDLTGNEDLVLEGTVEGKVELPNNQLTVGANGVVRAEIQAKSIVVVGKVTGNIHGSERIEIQATGVVDGDVQAPRLVVHEGAVLNGAISMGATASAAPGASTTQPSAPKAASAAGEAA